MLPSFPSAQDTVICCPFYQFSGITATYHRNDAKFPCYNRGMTGASSFVSDYVLPFHDGSQSGFVKSVTRISPSNN
jgi:hypothetical protein